MFKKIALVLSAAAMTAIPAVAEAQEYYGAPYGYGYAAPAYGYPAYGYDNSYERYRCSRNTTTGAAIGGIAGALLGRSLARRGHYSYRYDRYRHGNRAMSTLIGGAVGAVAGGAVASNNCY